MMIQMSLMKKFINLLMIAGKKHVAYKLFFTAGSQFLHLIQRIPNESSHFPKNLTSARAELLRKRKNAISQSNQLLFHLYTAIKHVQPNLEGRKCRVAGTTKLVPAVISQERGYALAIRWIIQSARKRKKGSRLPFYQCLAQEFLDAYQRQGGARLRRDASHKTCEGNRGFLRYRWW